MLISVVGCSTQSDPDPEGPLSVADFVGTEWERRTLRMVDLEVEFQEELGDCLRSAGFEYTPPDVRREAMLAIETQREIVGEGGGYHLRYLPTPEAAAARGFGISAWINDAPVVAVSDPNSSYLETLSEEEGLALAREMERCEERAEANSGMDEVASLELKGLEIGEEVDERLQASPELQALDMAWSACFAASGRSEIQAETPFELVFSLEDLAAQPDGISEEFRDLEFALAQQSADCIQATSYIDEFEEISSRIREQVLAQHGY